MKTIVFSIGFNERKPTPIEIEQLRLRGAKQIEVMTKIVTTYNFEGGLVKQEDELDDSYLNCTMEIPDNWPFANQPFQSEKLEESLILVLESVFGEMDRTPTGESLPDYPVWWLDDYDEELS